MTVNKGKMWWYFNFVLVSLVNPFTNEVLDLGIIPSWSQSYSGLKKFVFSVLQVHTVRNCGLRFCSRSTVKYCTVILRNRNLGIRSITRNPSNCYQVQIRTCTFLFICFVMRVKNSGYVKVTSSPLCFWVMSFLFWRSFCCYLLCSSILCLSDTDLFKTLVGC